VGLAEGETMSTGMMGVGFYDSGRSARTRDWSRPPESETVKPKSQTELLADIYLAAHERREAEERAEEQRKVEEQRRRQEAERKKQEELQQRERVERDNKRRRIEFDNAEFQIAAMFDQYGLSGSERTSVDETLLRLQLWKTPISAVERATVEAMRIVAERK
jgi:hypothetical protein